MRLSTVYIENFRIFGNEEDLKHLDLHLHPGLNVLVGENDSGKSAVVDAIRYVLWTTSFEYHKLSDDDFHVKGTQRSESFTIRLCFSDLSINEKGRYLEWLTVEDSSPCLYVHFQATRTQDVNGRTRVTYVCHSGKKGDGPTIEGSVRDFLRVTYLRPLRDAERELSAGKGSRLSQILHSHPDFKSQAKDDYNSEDPGCKPETLIGIMRQAEHMIQQNKVIKDTEITLKSSYLDHLSLHPDPLTAAIGIARNTELRQILERFEIGLDPQNGTNLRTPRGLGLNNILFMATELLLLAGDNAQQLPLLLIEEPEAHLHPQLQLKLMDFLKKKSEDDTCQVQIIATTHSPNLASRVGVEPLTLMHKGAAFPLALGQTKLEPSDYRFLKRFLDVTKSNMFFAKGVIVVEGDAENILLPTIARLLDRDLTKYGVSIVKIGHTGFFRFTRIYQRDNDPQIPIRVACIADLDMPSDEAKAYLPEKRKTASQLGDECRLERIKKLTADDAAPVKTFPSNHWTLEFDLARSGLAACTHTAIQLAKKEKGRKTPLSLADYESVRKEAGETFADWQENYSEEKLAAEIFAPLLKHEASKAVAAQHLADLLESIDLSTLKIFRSMVPAYLVEAIDYVTFQDEPAEDPADASQH